MQIQSYNAAASTYLQMPAATLQTPPQDKPSTESPFQAETAEKTRAMRQGESAPAERDQAEKLAAERKEAQAPRPVTNALGQTTGTLINITA